MTFKIRHGVIGRINIARDRFRKIVLEYIIGGHPKDCKLDMACGNNEKCQVLNRRAVFL